MISTDFWLLLAISFAFYAMIAVLGNIVSRWANRWKSGK